MTRRKYEKLDFPTIQKINWSIADLIRDKGNGKNEDTQSIALPLLVLKRFLDLREEYKVNTIRNLEEYSLLDNDLAETLRFNGLNKDTRYEVDLKNINWYDIEWDDIMRFPNNHDAVEIDYHLGVPDDEDYDKRLTIKTTAKNQIEFMFKVFESFSSSVVKEMLEDFDFENKFIKILPEAVQKEALLSFDEYKFTLEYVNEDLFGDAYMDLTGRFAASGGKKGGEFFTPTELTKAITRMRDPKIEQNTDYYLADLTSGACTFMIYAAEHIMQDKSWNLDQANDHIRFVTQEKEKTSELFGKLNILLHGYKNHTSYHANTILNWKRSIDGSDAIGVWEGKLDCILANPPYGLKDYGFEYAIENQDKETRWDYGIPSKGEGEYAFILSTLNLLKEKGEAAIVLPLGTLFKDSTKNIRQKLIEEGVVEAIVNMPSGMFLTTQIPVCVWFLKKGRTQEEIDKGIYMMEASDCFEKDGKNNKFSGEKAERAINTFVQRETVEGFSQYVSNEDIKNSDYNLSVSRYVFQEEDKENIDINSLNDEISDLYEKLSLGNSKIIDMF